MTTFAPLLTKVNSMNAAGAVVKLTTTFVELEDATSRVEALERLCRQKHEWKGNREFSTVPLLFLT